MLTPPVPDVSLHVSAFDNAWDNHPKPRATTLAGLVRALTSFPVIEASDKRALPAWSPARFVPGATRRAENVEAVSCLVLDFDEGDPDAALAAWAGTFAVLHTTWSHSPEAPRFRVVLPLARPVEVARWRDAWSWASRRAWSADPACKDPSRLYFRPARPRADAPHLALVQEGDLLDVVPLLPEPPPAAEVRARRELRVSARLLERAVRMRFAADPASREHVAAEIGARVTGNADSRRAVGIPCPSCGRASVWFFVAPSRLRRARCNHRSSCGWSGPLDELFVRSAA